MAEEIRGQRTEDRGQRSEVRDQRSGRPKTFLCSVLCPLTSDLCPLSSDLRTKGGAGGIEPLTSAFTEPRAIRYTTCRIN